ncbi:MAG: 30S ribosomal protein S17e [Candidatus Nanoarchaeia archaeon]|nr:30S ribosomal protein S17e [Candidatus Nanoarchaeia archaeon]
MGRVRNTFIKRNAGKIIEKHPDSFSKSFEENKKSLQGKAEFMSKKIRNRVAGYLAFIKKKGKSLKKVE